MAIADYVVLSSSPVVRSFSMSQDESQDAPFPSQDLPSSSQLRMARLVRHTSDSSFKPVPDYSGPGFTSAATLPRPTQPNSQDDSKVCNMRYMLKAKELLADLEPKPLESLNEIRKDCQNGDRPKSPRGLVKERGVEDKKRNTAGTKRSKHFARDPQTKIKKTNITKPGAASSTTKRSKGKVTDVQPDREDNGYTTEVHRSTNEQGLGRAEAVERIRDRMPSKESLVRSDPPNEPEALLTATTITTASIHSETPARFEVPNESFGKHVEDFGYLDTSHATITGQSRSASGESGTKRRKLNLVPSLRAVQAKLHAAKRNKSPKKKPQTITDKATAPFVPTDPGSNSIQDFFGVPVDTDTRSKQADDSTGVSGDTIPRKRAKISKVKTRAVKKTSPALKLVSPEAAIKTAKEQDLLFGTSSQLARDDSPAFTRQVQQAMKESETCDTSASVPRETESQISHQSATSRLSTSVRSSASLKMWSEAARDSAGLLLPVDVVNLVDTPQSSRTVGHPLATETVQAPSACAHDESLVAIENTITVDVADAPIPVLELEQHILPRSVAEASLRERPRSKSPIKKGKKHKDSTEESFSEIPNYQAFNDAHLNKELENFGFKRMRRREDILPLLRRCWESKKRIALQSLPPNVPGTSKPASDVSPKEAAKPDDVTEEIDSPRKKKRGRPAKKFVDQATNDGPQDPENITTPKKKPRGRPRKEGTETKEPQPKKAQKETSDDAEHAPSLRPPRKKRSSPKRKASSAHSRALSATTTTILDTTALFASTSKAITTFPPTHDVKNLTWQEKILLYDPIVLEDLTDWLNSEDGLRRVGYYEEGKMMTPGLAKQWCETQSVCCTWKENLRGGTRARY